MSSGTLENQPKQKSGRAIALPAPPPPRSLTRKTSGLNEIVTHDLCDIDAALYNRLSYQAKWELVICEFALIP